MPTYEYVCLKCGEEFVRIMTMTERESAKIACPKCSSEDTRQQMTAFMPKTSRKS